MDERLRFVARVLDGEKMAVLCREFDISRKTGYKIFSRYKDCGLEGLTDRSRRPYRQGCQLPFQIENLILQLKRVPFASANSLFGLSRLSVWWLRLGIGIERIQPAHPEQNGRHERMHLTLKKEATKPAAKNLLQQQGRFDRFIQEYNQERPHQALGMKYPAELYVSSSRPYRGLSDLEYPFHDRTITVTCCGRICIGRRKINLSTVFAGQNVGIKEVSDKVWLVSFMQYDLGFFDHETGRITSAENPFGAKVLPMCPE